MISFNKSDQVESQDPVRPVLQTREHITEGLYDLITGTDTSTERNDEIYVSALLALDPVDRSLKDGPTRPVREAVFVHGVTWTILALHHLGLSLRNRTCF